MVTGNGLKRWRKRLDYSQMELSIAAGISPAMIVAIERYGYLPGPEVRAKLAKTLNIEEATLWPSLAGTAEVK